MTTLSNFPKVSFLVTVFNGLPFLKNTIQSLVDQTYPSFEIIIVDDGSTDGTTEYLRDLEKKLEYLKVFFSERIGRGKALNLGLQNCSGKYIAVNDADDISLPNRIEEQVAFLEENTAHVLVGSKMKLLNLQSGEVTEDTFKQRPVSHEEITNYFLTGQPIQHSTALIRRTALEAVNGYNEKINFLYDRDLFIRLAAIGKLHNLDKVLIHLGRHNDQFFYHTYTGKDRIKRDYHYRFKAVDLLNLPFYKKIPIWLKLQWNFVPIKYRNKIKKILGK